MPLIDRRFILVVGPGLQFAAADAAYDLAVFFNRLVGVAPVISQGGLLKKDENIVTMSTGCRKHARAKYYSDSVCKRTNLIPY